MSYFPLEMENSSILLLNDDCLSRVVSFIDDTFTFHSVILSCKRFHQIASNMEDFWHSNVRRAKIENPLKKAIIEMFSREEYCDDRVEMWFELDQVFDDAIDLAYKKTLWNYPKLVEIWDKCGPVAATIFTWIRSMKYKPNLSYSGPKSSSFYWEFTIHLPSSDQDMIFSANYCHPNDLVEISVGAHRLGISLHVSCGELFHGYQGSISMLPNEYLSWDVKEKKKIIQEMEPILELLQVELDETTPHITPNFFIWLCLFYAADNVNNELPDEDQLCFKNSPMNEKPTLESFNRLLTPNICQLAEEKFKEALSKYRENNFSQIDEISKPMNMIQIQAFQGRTQLLKDLKGQFNRLAPIAKEFHHYSPEPFLKKALLGLFQRTTFKSTDIFIPPGKEEFENEVLFRLKDGNVLKVLAKMHFAGNKFSYDCQLEIKFMLPNEEVIKLNTVQSVENVNGYSNIYKEKGCWMGLQNPFLKYPLLVEDLGPVTVLLQECIDYSMQGEQDVPKIYNLFTALYFLAMLDCMEVIGQFKDILCVEEPNDLSDELNQVLMKIAIQ